MTPFIGKVKEHNNHMHSDSKKRRSFLALHFAAGDVKQLEGSDDRPRSLKDLIVSTIYFNVPVD